MECLDEGTTLGTDEQGCEVEVETMESTVHTSTQKEIPNSEADSNREAESSTVFRSPENDLGSLFKEKGREGNRVEIQGGTLVTPTAIEWPCGGLLQTFYGTFSPPTLRGPALFCVWTLDPQDSRPLRLDLQQLVLGPGDKLTVFNREDGKGDVLKTVSFVQIRGKDSLFY